MLVFLITILYYLNLQFYMYSSSSLSLCAALEFLFPVLHYNSIFIQSFLIVRSLCHLIRKLMSWFSSSTLPALLHWILLPFWSLEGNNLNQILNLG